MPRRSDWLVDQLPMALRADPFLCSFLGIFQEVADGVQVHAHALVDIVDVNVTPPEMVRWMGTWLGVDCVDPSMPDELQRRLVRGIGRLAPWRGTKRGLQALLELVTAAPVTVVDTGRVVVAGEAVLEHPFVWVDVQDAAGCTDEYLTALVAAELPPDVGFALRVGSRSVIGDADGGDSRQADVSLGSPAARPARRRPRARPSGPTPQGG